MQPNYEKPKKEKEGKQKFEEFSGIEESADKHMEDTTIILQLLKYFGKDVNLLELFDQYVKVHRRISDEELEDGASAGD